MCAAAPLRPADLNGWAEEVEAALQSREARKWLANKISITFAASASGYCHGEGMRH